MDALIGGAAAGGPGGALAGSVVGGALGHLAGTRGPSMAAVKAEQTANGAEALSQADGSLVNRTMTQKEALAAAIKQLLGRRNDGK